MLRRILPRHLCAPEAAAAATPATPAATPAAEPAATPAEPAEPAEPDAPAEPAAPVTGKDDELLSALLGDYRGDEPKIEPAPEVVEEVAPDPAAAVPAVVPAATPAPASPAAPAKARKRVEIMPPETPTLPPPAAPVSAKPTLPAPTVDADEDYVRGLTAEQQEELNEASVAEQLMPDRHKDRRKKLIAYYRNVDATATKLLTDNAAADYNLDDDAHYKQVLASKPKLEVVDMRKVQRKMGNEELRRELEPELTEIKRKQVEVEVQPQLAVVADNFSRAAREAIAADEKSPMAPVLKMFAEKGIEAAKHEFPLESEIMIEEGAKSRERAREYVRLVHMTKAGHNVFDANNPIHAELVDFINTEGDRFVQDGGDLLVRGGKRFLPRAQYGELLKQQPGEAGKYWTFSDSDVLGMMAQQSKTNMENRIAGEVETAKRRGFVRSAATASAVAPTSTRKDPQPLNPPKAQPSAAKGPGSGPATIQTGDINPASLYY